MRNRGLIAAGCVAALLSGALLEGCTRTEAQQRTAGAPQACKASITPVGNTKGCPMAPVHFHMSVGDCAQSSGTFSYHYLYVTEGSKETLERSRTWISRKQQWDQADPVPAACDAEMDDVEIDKISSCSCTQH